MSFGWSAGDIVAALNLLHKVVAALKDTGGASSDYQDVSSFLSVLTVTLQHLKALQAAPLDPDLARNLGKLCEQVRGPLESICERICTSFERDLGSDSVNSKIWTAGRKLQWALSTSKKVKELRERIGGPIAAIGIVLSQQVVQTALQMPAEIQARIAHTIDTAVNTRISPQTLEVQNAVTALSTAQKNSAQLIERTIRSVEKNTKEVIQNHSQSINLDVDIKFNALSISHTACAEGIVRIEDKSRTTLEAVKSNTAASVAVVGSISDLSSRHSQSTDLILQRVLQTEQQTVHTIHKHGSASREQISSLHQKLDHMNLLMGTVKDRMSDLSITQRSASSSTSNLEIQKAIGNIYQSIWLLVSALHALIQELIYLLAPYLVAIYRTSIQSLLLCGDHFLFEDAIGRRKWLPCLQFQHWDTFYNLLIDTFQGEAGLPRVLNGQFAVLNGFNEMPIHKKAWRAGIQPKTRVNMAIVLEMVRKGRCANPSCPGLVEFGTGEVTRICPTCGKHLSTLKDLATEDADYGSEASFSFEFGSNIQLMTPIANQKATLDQVPPTMPKSRSFRSSNNTVDKDIIAYKRVIWRHSDEIEIQGNVQHGILEEPNASALKWHSRRSRGAQARHKPSQRGRKSDNPGSVRQETTATAHENQAKPTQNKDGPIAPRNAYPLQGYRKVSLNLEQYDDIPEEDSMIDTQALTARIGKREFLSPKRPWKRILKSQALGDRPSTGGGGHALQDYQMQLLLLEQQNKKMLMMARLEADAIAMTRLSGTEEEE